MRRSPCSTTCSELQPRQRRRRLAARSCPVPQRPTAHAGSAQRTQALLEHLATKWSRSAASPPYTSRLGRRDEAKSLVRSALEIAPNDAESKRLLDILSGKISANSPPSSGQPDVSGEFANIKGGRATKSKKQRKKGSKKASKTKGSGANHRRLLALQKSRSSVRSCSAGSSRWRTRPRTHAFHRATKSTSFSRTPITIFETCKPNSSPAGPAPSLHPLKAAVTLSSSKRNWLARRTWRRTTRPCLRRRWQPSAPPSPSHRPAIRAHRRPRSFTFAAASYSAPASCALRSLGSGRSIGERLKI